jgi:hypothetical protein
METRGVQVKGVLPWFVVGYVPRASFLAHPGFTRYLYRTERGGLCQLLKLRQMETQGVPVQMKGFLPWLVVGFYLVPLFWLTRALLGRYTVPYLEGWPLPTVETKANGDSRSSVHEEGVLPCLVVGYVPRAPFLAHPGPTRYGIPYREWWPLPAVETEENGDSWSTYERGPSLVG